MNGKKAIEQIKKIIKRERANNAANEILRFFAVASLCFLSFALLEVLLHFGKNTRTLIFAGLAACALFNLIKFALPALARFFAKIEFSEIVEKAYELGQNFPQVKDELANALELIENAKENYSEALVKAATEKALSSLPQDFFDDARKLPRVGAARLFVIFVAAFFLLANGELQNAAVRIIYFSKEFKPPQEFFFSVAPGDTTIAKGDTLTLEIGIKGKAPRMFELFVKREDEAEFISRRKFKTTREKYYYKFEKIQSPFRYYLAGDEVTSDTFAVAVIKPPFVREINATVYFPKYTRLKPLKIEGDGNIDAIYGSTAKIEIIANKKIKAGSLVFSSGRKIPLKINGQNLSASFKVLRKDEYKIKLKDTLGYENRFPIGYAIEVSEDEFPEVEILLPGKDTELGNEDIIPLAIKISDDYGFEKLLLRFRLAQSDFKKPGENFSTKRLPLGKGTAQTVFYDWNIRPLNIEVNETYEYYVEIYDNDKLKGPKKTESKKYRIYLPPLEKFLAKTEKENLKTLEEFKKSLQEAEKLKEEMRQIANKLKKKDPKINWEEKQKVKNAAKKFEELAKRAEKLKEKLAAQQKELEKRNLLSPETIKKYEELQKLLSKLNDETLKKALQKMNKSLEKMQTDDVRKQMEELKKNEEAFRKSIERTIELFKRLLAEQKTDEILKRMEEIQKEQQKIAEETKKENSEKQLDELTKKQADLKKKLNNLQKETEKLSEMMKDLEDMPSHETEKLAKEMQNQKNDELAEQAASNMMMRNMEQAQQMQNQLMQNMAQMMQQMQNIQNQMRMQNQMKTMAEMMRLTREIIALSKKEEELKNKISSSDLSNSEIRKLAEEQNEILQNIDMLLQRMQQLSNKTFAVTPEMGNALGKARMQMNGAIGDLEQRSRFGVKSKTQSAMASLNEAAEMMQNMLNAMANQQGQGQGGMMSLMQQLKKMSGMQMQINAQTKQMQGSGKSQQQLAQMQRLAAQQAALRKSLEELNKEAKTSGKSKQLAANLERVEEEMKEIIADLQSGNLNDELIKKQERILSRLLDAQRSINERDFEKRREAKAGKTIARKSPDKLRLHEEEKSRLEKELLEAEKEGYKNDYRELIKKYYKQLKIGN